VNDDVLGIVYVAFRCDAEEKWVMVLFIGF
jgi:hypothetical protein